MCAKLKRKLAAFHLKTQHTKPIIVPYKQALDVAEEHRNEIIITVVFALREGATSKEDEASHIILKEFPSDTVSDERKAFLDQEQNIIYHHMLKKYYDPTIDDYICRSRFFADQANYPADWYNLPLAEQVFIKFKRAKSVGCQHYIRGCDLLCPICNKYYTCRMCHDENVELTHNFPRYEITQVRCKYCSHVQKISQ